MPFVPANFEIPATLETAEFRLRMLTVHDLVKDYDAVVSSADHLKTVFPGGYWPDGLTLEQNLIDLGWHQKEFQKRRSFAYTVVTPCESQVLGCVYIDPPQKIGFDANVFLWARQSMLASGMEIRLYEAVRDWLERDWPLRKVAFPCRNINWEQWSALADAG